MREAVGGSLLLYLVIPIIVLFIIFIGFIMNYAAAYRAANYVVTQIENCQGQMSNCAPYDANWQKTLYEEIKTKYSYLEPGTNKVTPCYISNGKNSYVFRVELPVSFDIPILGILKPMVVKAETKTISNVSNVTASYSLCS